MKSMKASLPFWLVSSLLLGPVISAGSSTVCDPGRVQLGQADDVLDREYRVWMEVQQNPGLDDYEKIKTTVTTYFRLMLESWLQGTLLDFGFLFDRSDPEAMADYVYEKGCHKVWLARWSDYGIRMVKYEHSLLISHSRENGRVKVQAEPEARLAFTDTPKPKRFEPVSLGVYNFGLEEKGGLWLIKALKRNSPDLPALPRGSDFDKMAQEISSSVPVINMESEFVKNMKRPTSPGFPDRWEKMRKELEKPHTLSLQDVKRNFKFHQISRIILIDKRFALAEQIRPRQPTWFHLFDLVSGEKQILPTGVDYVRLHKINGPNEFIFLGDGRNSETIAVDFPFVLTIRRYTDGTDFGGTFREERQPRYIPVRESVEFGCKSPAVVLDVKVTIQGLEISFGPMEGFEGDFYADFTNIPVTKTEYHEKEHHFMIIFKNTRAPRKSIQGQDRIDLSNDYLNSVWWQQEGPDCRFIVSLKKTANFYRGFRQTDTEYVRFTFHAEDLSYLN